MLFKENRTEIRRAAKRRCYGVATLPTALGGLSMSMAHVEVILLRQFLIPIPAFASMTILGIMLGSLGYVIV